jgi:hypothetical protein
VNIRNNNPRVHSSTSTSFHQACSQALRERGNARDWRDGNVERVLREQRKVKTKDKLSEKERERRE